MSAISHILAIQPKRIGDLILTAPAIEALRHAFPGAEISLVAAGASGGIAPLLGADETLIYRYRRPNFAIWSRLATSHFDLTLDFGGTDRSALMTRISRAPIRVTYQKFVSGKRRARAYTHLSNASVRDLHTVDFHRALVEEAVRSASADGQNSPPQGSAPDPIPLHLTDQLTSAAHQKIEARSQIPVTRYAIIHPGTARPEKYWLPKRWADVIRHTTSLGLTPVITGSNDPEEISHLAQIHTSLRQNPPAIDCIDLAGEISLPELAALIASAELAIGVDSAAMHLAATFGRPQIVLFGPTNPFHWRPRHPEASVFIASSPDSPTTEFTPRHKKAPMSHISTPPVVRAIDTLLR